MGEHAGESGCEPRGKAGSPATLEQLLALSPGDIYFRMVATWNRYRYPVEQQKAMAFDFYQTLHALVPPKTEAA